MKGEYGYIFLVRMGQDGVRFIDSWLDVSRFIGPTFQEFVAAQQVKARLQGQKIPDVKDFARELTQLSTMRLRGRYNMMDGPLYVRTEDPMTYDEMNTLVASKNNKEYQDFIKRFKSKF